MHLLMMMVQRYQNRISGTMQWDRIDIHIDVAAPFQKLSPVSGIW